MGEVPKHYPQRVGTRPNVLGFMNRHNDLHAYMFEQSIHTGVVIASYDQKLWMRGKAAYLG